jgi:hypothetical protein
MNIEKAIAAIKADKMHFDRLDHDFAVQIVSQIVLRRLEELEAEHGDDFEVIDACDRDTRFGHIQGTRTACKIVDWHMHAGSKDALQYVCRDEDCGITAE